MPRKTTKSLQRLIKPDRKYNSVQVQRLINKSMLNGKKHAAERMVYAALELAAKKVKSENPLEVLETALSNISPNYEVQGHRQEHFAFMWLVQAARARKGAPYQERLAGEIVDAINQTGAAYKKKEDTHRMAEANRAFAHFARS